LQEQSRTSHIHERAYRNKPLTPEQEAENTERSRVRVRVEHIFGHIETAMNGCYVRTIGFARAQAKIGMENMAYNISRFSFLMRGVYATTRPELVWGFQSQAFYCAAYPFCFAHLRVDGWVKGTHGRRFLSAEWCGVPLRRTATRLRIFAHRKPFGFRCCLAASSLLLRVNT